MQKEKRLNIPLLYLLSDFSLSQTKNFHIIFIFIDKKFPNNIKDFPRRNIIENWGNSYGNQITIKRRKKKRWNNSFLSYTRFDRCIPLILVFLLRCFWSSRTEKKEVFVSKTLFVRGIISSLLCLLEFSILNKMFISKIFSVGITFLFFN